VTGLAGPTGTVTIPLIFAPPELFSLVVTLDRALWSQVFEPSNINRTVFADSCNYTFESKPPSSRAGFKEFSNVDLAMKNGEGLVDVTAIQEPRRQVARWHIDLRRHRLGGKYNMVHLSIPGN